MPLDGPWLAATGSGGAGGNLAAMPVLVGLDCGGSSTRVLAVNEAGDCLFRGQSGAANLLSTPGELIEAHLRKAVQGCPPADAVAGCFAGLVGEEARALARQHLARLFPGARLRIEPDYAAALAACGPGTRACVIAGTGSIVCSRGPSGWRKTGGRGPALGDPGSAATIGRRGLSGFLDNPEDAGPQLRKAVLASFGSDQEAEIVARLYGASTPASKLAELAAAVGHDAAAGLPYATRIVEEEMAHLARLAALHLGRWPGEGNQIGLSGGLWKAHPIFRKAFIAAAVDSLGGFDVFVLRRPPVEGAAALAREAWDGD